MFNPYLTTFWSTDGLRSITVNQKKKSEIYVGQIIMQFYNCTSVYIYKLNMFLFLIPKMRSRTYIYIYLIAACVTVFVAEHATQFCSHSVSGRENYIL